MWVRTSTNVEIKYGYKTAEPGFGLNASTDPAECQIAWRCQGQAKLPKTWSRNARLRRLTGSKTVIRGAGRGDSAAVSSLTMNLSSATIYNLLTPVTCSSARSYFVYCFVVIFSQGHSSLMKHVRPYSRGATHQIFLVEPSRWPHNVGEMTIDGLPVGSRVDGPTQKSFANLKESYTRVIEARD